MYIQSIGRSIITPTDRDNNVLTDWASGAHKLFFLSCLSKDLRDPGGLSCYCLRGFAMAGYLTAGMLHFPGATSGNQLVLAVDIF